MSPDQFGQGYVNESVPGFDYFLHPFNGKRWVSNGFHGNGHKLHWVIISGNPVGAKLTTALAAVNNCPFSILSHPHGDRLHYAAAIRFPITRFNIQVKRVQAVGTVVSVIASCACRCDKPATVLAGKTFLTGMGFVIAFFKLFSFIFPIHGLFPPKSNQMNPFGRYGLFVTPTSRSVHNCLSKQCLHKNLL